MRWYDWTALAIVGIVAILTPGLLFGMYFWR